MTDFAAPTSADTLKTLVDTHSLSTVLEMLAEIAYEKAEHLRANWGDEKAARVYERASVQIDAVRKNARFKL